VALHSRPGVPTTLSGSARDRVLEIADYRFYADGIPQTSIDAIVAEAGVSVRAFTKAFSSKEDLVVAYVLQRHARDVDLFSTISATKLSPHLLFHTLLSEVIVDVTSPDFRGCAFINAAIECREYTAVQSVVREHREWYAEAARQVLIDARHSRPGDAADDVLLARDGAMVSRYGGDPVAATSALRRAIERVLREIPASDSHVSI